MASTQPTSPMDVLIRIGWMFLGPATLFLLAYNLSSSQKGWLAPSSIAFLVVLVMVVIARWLDPRTSEGEPTTPAHLRKYTLTTVGVGLAAWVIANLLGNHWLAA